MLKFPLCPKTDYTALSLNYKLPKFFDAIWASAKLRIAADGGANRIHRRYIEQGNPNYIIPHIVAGDFDSLKPETREFMEKRGTKFVTTENQDYTDVQKNTLVALEHNSKDPFLVMGGYGGRFDHTIGVIHASLWCTKTPLWLLDDNNLMVWLRPNLQHLSIPREWTTGKCSLIPLSEPVDHIETKGLQYDLNGPLELGKSVSLSNRLIGTELEFKTTGPVLFSTQIPEERLTSPLE